MTDGSVVSEQEEQFKLLVEQVSSRALREVNPDREGLERLIKRGDEFQRHIVSVIRQFTFCTPEFPSYKLARSILGTDFISPEEIARIRLDICYTAEQLSYFDDTMPSREVLEWCRDNGYLLVAGPGRPMSLLQVCALKPRYFYPADGDWYTEPSKIFSRRDLVDTRWIMFRKEPAPNSAGKNWDEQQSLLSAVETVPNIAEVAWCTATYRAVRSIYLLRDIFVRTSSLAACDGQRVDIGYLEGIGFNIRYWWESGRDDYLGVSSARKPD